MKLPIYNVLLQKINILKQQSFIDWPLSLQRALISIACFMLFWIVNIQLFNTREQMQIIQKKRLDELTQQIKMQQKIIQQAENYLRKKNSNIMSLSHRTSNLSLSNIMTQFSTLSKQNHLEIQSIKPIKIQTASDYTIESLQIDATGKYADLLQFMYQVTTQLVLGIAHFQIKRVPEKNVLQLITEVNFYAKPKN